MRMTLPAEAGSLREFCAFVRAGAEGGELTPEDLDKLDLVLEELFMNIARYAYHPGRGDVEVAYVREAPRRLLIQISDSGREFDPLASNPPDFTRGLADRPLGGMGIFLVKTIANSVRYERDGNFNRLSFVFTGG